MADEELPAALVGVSVYGCDPDESALFRSLAPSLGVAARLTEAAVSEANVELATGTRCVSVGHKDKVDGSTLRSLSEVGVQYLTTRSAGYDHIDVRCARDLGISVEGVAYSPGSVADYTLMLMLLAVRNARSTIIRSNLHDFRLNAVRGKELGDLTIGVIGTGRIGGAVIKRLRGFGCRVLAWDRNPRAAAHFVHLDELLRDSDIVTLHTPLDHATRHLLNRQRIGQMKRGSILVNTSRGGLVDTDALVSALETSALGGAALDVVEGEEGIFYTDRRGRPIADSLFLRLQQIPNVVITPHTAYYTDHALRDTVENTLLNCVKFEGGRRD